MDRRVALKQRLQALDAGDAEENEYRRRMLDLLESSGDPFHRGHYTPGHFTASAFVLHPTQPQLLLILHGKLRMWLQPGGHVDPSDVDLEQAARREVREETGLSQLVRLGEGIVDVDVHPIPARKQEPQHEHFDVRFAFRAEQADARAASDAADARWVSLPELDQLQTDRSVMRAVEKLTRRQLLD